MIIKAEKDIIWFQISIYNAVYVWSSKVSARCSSFVL